MCKYLSLTDLKAAYDSGELTEPITIDNDSVYTPDITYEAHPSEVLEQALDLLGIPHEAA